MSEPTESIVPADYVHDDVHAVAEYRSVSTLAVFAAVLGVASTLATVAKSLLVVPLMGVVCAALALQRIGNSEGQLAGRGAALVGLVLSLAIGSGVLVRDYTRDRLVAAEAEQWAADWCQLLLDDQVLTALELKNAPEVRRPFDDSLAEYYATNEAAITTLEEFREDPVVVLLTNAAEGARVEQVEFIGVSPAARGGFHAAYGFRLVSPESASDGSDQVFQVYVTRSRNGGVWQVSDFRMAE